MRSLVVDMVGVVGVWVCGVVCLVSVDGLESVECVCMWRARSDSGEWVRWVVGFGCGGVGDFGSVGQKNFTISWLLLKFADFRGE